MNSNTSFDEYLCIALEAAQEGAKTLLRQAPFISQKPLAIKSKSSPIDLVTEVDRKSEEAILTVLRDKSPADILIVAEESSSGPVAPEPEMVWYVDPLDGTTNYAHGHPFYCVSIALVFNHKPVVGVINSPGLGVIWSGTIHQAYRFEYTHGAINRMAVSITNMLDQAFLATGFPYDRRSSNDDNLAAYCALMKQTQGVLRCGSAAIDLAMVADGTYDGFWERKLKPWDIAAGAALVLGAGGSISDPWGREILLTEGSILASNQRLHQELRNVLIQHLPPACERNVH